MSTAAERNRRSRQRRREGLRSWDLDLPDAATEQLLDALLYYGRLNESEAEDDERVRAEIAAVAQRLLIWWARHWRELDRSTGLSEIPPIRVSRTPHESES